MSAVSGTRVARTSRHKLIILMELPKICSAQSHRESPRCFARACICVVIMMWIEVRKCMKSGPLQPQMKIRATLVDHTLICEPRVPQCHIARDSLLGIRIQHLNHEMMTEVCLAA